MSTLAAASAEALPQRVEGNQTLYHWCADHMLDSILRQGLTRGVIAWMEGGNPVFRRGFQWLTRNPERDAQEWCHVQYSTLPYDRCANRLTVMVPAHEALSLSCWADCGPLIVPPEQYEVLSAFGNPRDHFVFRGNVKPAWITRTERLGARWYGRRTA